MEKIQNAESQTTNFSVVKEQSLPKKNPGNEAFMGAFHRHILIYNSLYFNAYKFKNKVQNARLIADNMKKLILMPLVDKYCITKKSEI